jgi:hypothetical protein
MRKTLRAAALVMVLCGSAFAGDIPNPSAPQPPTGIMSAEETTADGELPDNGTADGFTETLLTLIKSVFALL